MKNNMPLWVQNCLWVFLIIFIVIALIFAILGIIAIIKYFLIEGKEGVRR